LIKIRTAYPSRADFYRIKMPQDPCHDLTKISILGLRKYGVYDKIKGTMRKVRHGNGYMDTMETERVIAPGSQEL
jgi:hypothetical protein